MGTNGFTLTTRDVVGLGGQTLTEFDSAGASHSNIPLASGVEATLTADPNTQAVTHFQFTDWLGTRRLQTDALGSPEESALAVLSVMPRPREASTPGEARVYHS